MRKTTIITLLCLCAVIMTSCTRNEHEYTKSLKEILGDDFESARILGVLDGKNLATLDLNTLKTRAIAEYPPVGSPDGLTRPHWSPDGKYVMVAYCGKARLMKEDGSEKRFILSNVEKVYEPSFWVDPETDDLCVVYKDINWKNDLKRGETGGTFLARLRSAETKKLFDIPCDAGLSLDGTHLGEAYRYAAIIDLTAGKVHQPYEGQTCNATMSPDNTYRLMYLRLPHTHFVIRNKYGKELWKIEKPEGSEEWGTPRWSMHPDICISTAKYDDGYKLVVIQISTKKVVVLRNLPGDWSRATVWLKSASLGIDSGEEQGITPEKAMLMLKDALKLGDAEQASAIYKEIAGRAPGSPAAEDAEKILKSQKFKAELNATPLLKDLWSLITRLAPVAGSESKFANTKYFERNRSVLILMTRKATEIIENHPETKAYSQASEIRANYGLPERTDLVLSETLVVDAVVDAVSRVPTAAQIVPYREVVTYISYKVDKVVKGAYGKKKIVVVHWGMKDAKHLPPATWKSGKRLRLTLDRFDSHPGLWRITKASGADDETLIPYWALKEEDL